MSTLADFRKLLKDRAGFTVVDEQVGTNQIRLVGRVPPNASQYWVLIVHHMLVQMAQRPWKVDISKHYFIRDMESGPRMFYAWRLIFQADLVADHLEDISGVVRSSPQPARVELQEYPLPGAGANRNEHKNGKGAGNVDKVLLGPMAATASFQARSGGGYGR